MPIIVVVILLLVGWNMPPPDFPHDIPRDLPWTLPDYRQAKTEFHILEDGRLAIHIEHLLLEGVTPEMIAWFYQVLPISRVGLDGKDYPLYHLFHPSEHGVIEIVEPANDGSAGMGVGALVQRREWFGPYNSKGAGRILLLGSSGMSVAPEVAGMQVGKIEHKFEAVPCGARYTVTAVLGSTTPLLGRLINRYIRDRQFPPEKIRQWLRHQVQEVSSLPFFLPALFAQRTVVPAPEKFHLSTGDIVNLGTCSSIIGGAVSSGQ